MLTTSASPRVYPRPGGPTCRTATPRRFTCRVCKRKAVADAPNQKLCSDACRHTSNRLAQQLCRLRLSLVDHMADIVADSRSWDEAKRRLAAFKVTGLKPFSYPSQRVAKPAEGDV